MARAKKLRRPVYILQTLKFLGNWKFKKKTKNTQPYGPLPRQNLQIRKKVPAKIKIKVMFISRVTQVYTCLGILISAVEFMHCAKILLVLSIVLYWEHLWRYPYNVKVILDKKSLSKPT